MVGVGTRMIFEKNMRLKNLNLPENHFQTNLIFSFIGGESPLLGFWSEGKLELQSPLVIVR